MALPVESKMIGEHVYKVTALDALAGRKVMARLLKVLGPAMAGLSKPEGKEEPGSRAAQAFADVLSRVTEEDVEALCNAFAPSTEVSAGAYGDKSPRLQGIFAVHFAGRYDELLQWLVFCLQVNFGSVFRVAGLGG